MSGEETPRGIKTAREAAIEAALGEWVQLVDRAETIKDELSAVDQALQADLRALGELVARMETAAGESEHAPNVVAPAAAIDADAIARAAREGAREALQAMKPAPAARATRLGWPTLVLVAALGGGAGAAATYFLNTDIEAAHAGRALMRAWPQLDGATKDKVEHAMRLR